MTALVINTSRSTMLIALMDGRALMAFSSDAAPPLRKGPNDPELRRARVCYDHLAGEMAVMLLDRMLADQWLEHDLSVTNRGWEKLAAIGLEPRAFPASKSPLCRGCLDWSHRCHHLAGSVGKAILDRIIESSWARRPRSSRVISFTPANKAGLLAGSIASELT